MHEQALMRDLMTRIVTLAESDENQSRSGPSAG